MHSAPQFRGRFAGISRGSRQTGVGRSPAVPGKGLTMSGRVKVLPVSRVGLGPFVAMAEHLRAALPGWEDTAPLPRNPSDLVADLAHAARHDIDGFLAASVDDEVVGFAVTAVRSRTALISHFWLLPDLQHPNAGEQLLRRCLAFGERAGVADTAAHLLAAPGHHALFFRFGLRPRFPVYRYSIEAEHARTLGQQLKRLLPGSEVTQDVLQRRIWVSDIDRLDRVTRSFVRPMDHEFWVNQRGLRVAIVREGKRVAGYAYGGPGQCGPVAATTPDAGLAALGWALELAAGERETPVHLLIPAPFEAASENLLEGGATLKTLTTWASRLPVTGMDRSVLGSVTLP